MPLATEMAMQDQILTALKTSIMQLLQQLKAAAAGKLVNLLPWGLSDDTAPVSNTDLDLILVASIYICWFAMDHKR